MNSFVQSGNFTRFIAILFLALTGMGALVVIILVTVYRIDVNPAVYTLMGGLVGSSGTFFAKASGVVDGASITQNAVNSVTEPMNNALNATPGSIDGPVQGNTQPVPAVGNTPPMA